LQVDGAENALSRGFNWISDQHSVREAWQCFVSGLLPVADLFRQ